MSNRINTALSLTALVVAVGAATPVGEAAWQLVVPRNSVGTLQLQRNAVKAAKIAPNAVRTNHVLNGALLAEDFKAGQLPQGPKGDKGDKGDRGPAGPGATMFTTTIGEGTSSTLATVGNGITLTGSCSSVTGSVLEIRTTSSSPTLQSSGTLATNLTLIPFFVDNTTYRLAFAGAKSVDLNGIARDSSGDNRFARIDVHGSSGTPSTPCHFWGMVIPPG